VPEVVVAEPVSWNTTRPAQHEILLEKVTNTYSTGSTHVELNVIVNEYDENSLSWPFEGGDGLSIGLTATANISAGHIHSVAIQFSKIDGNAFLYISKHPDAIRLHNLELQKIVDLQKESYIEVLGISQPDFCKLGTFSSWVFFDENNVNHQMITALEVTYFNGTAYRKAVLPIQLGVFVP